MDTSLGAESLQTGSSSCDLGSGVSGPEMYLVTLKPIPGYSSIEVIVSR